jgi:hypothetical protein
MALDLVNTTYLPSHDYDTGKLAFDSFDSRIAVSAYAAFFSSFQTLSNVSREQRFSKSASMQATYPDLL